MFIEYHKITGPARAIGIAFVYQSSDQRKLVISVGSFTPFSLEDQSSNPNGCAFKLNLNQLNLSN